MEDSKELEIFGNSVYVSSGTSSSSSSSSGKRDERNDELGVNARGEIERSGNIGDAIASLDVPLLVL